MDWLGRVKQRKNEMGMTNEELAEKTGMPVGTLNKILAGSTSSPKLSTVIAIADALGVSTDYLVSGTEEKLPKSEAELLQKIRELDERGLRCVNECVDSEYNRVQKEKKKAATAAFDIEEDNTRELIFYDAPVSAGCGCYLDTDNIRKLTINLTPITERADFALRVSGDSMEPRFSDGDIVIVESDCRVDYGKIGIFIVNGEGYIKKFGSDRLISLNPAYNDIVFGESDRVECKGLVLGRLKKSSD